MESIEQQKVFSTNDVFNSRFLDTKSIYIYYFNELPSMHYRTQINGEKAYQAFILKYKQQILKTYQYRWYNVNKKRTLFDTTIVVMNNHCAVEFNAGWCIVFHDNIQPDLVIEIDQLISQFKEKQKRAPLEMNLIVRSSEGYDLREMEIKRTKLDLDLFYGDDLKETDLLIRKRLGQKKDKGIVLLHGLPGSGKTTYLRYLIGKLKKKILFLSPEVATYLLNPDFIKLLIDNPNSVLIIEDAEKIIMDRKLDAGSAVSNLLNISDGLLADCLNVQLICTFNSPLTMIDSALLRKGRLIAKYEFGKLGIAKSQRLSDHLGFKTTITRPMTIADIAGQNEQTQKINSIEVAGFRRHHIEN